jgi:hypothetical protein
LRHENGYIELGVNLPCGMTKPSGGRSLLKTARGAFLVVLARPRAGVGHAPGLARHLTTVAVVKAHSAAGGH